MQNVSGTEDVAVYLGTWRRSDRSFKSWGYIAMSSECTLFGYLPDIMSTPTHFKLAKSDSLTRRVSFAAFPSWDELAARIQALYHIEDPAVSYIDSDGDAIVLSSDEELRDFYQSSELGQVVKFTVVDLSDVRTLDSSSSGKPLPATPFDSSLRNPFSGGQLPMPFLFEVEDDWQRLGMGGTFESTPIEPNSDSPHAFVEVIPSDTERASVLSGSDNRTVSDQQTPTLPPVDKGKAKATSSSDDASTVSVLNDDAPDKPPVHIQIHRLRNFHSGTFGPTSSTDKAFPNIPPAPASPEADATVLEDKTATRSSTSLSLDEAPAQPESTTDDPPLPEVGPAPGAASLYNDIAQLLNSLSTAVSSHPELSEGIRNVVRNATNGAYWEGGRQSVAHVVEDLRRAAQEARESAPSSEDLHRRAEEEAGRRVADAIGSVFRAFGEATRSTSSDDAPPFPPSPRPESRDHHQPPPFPPLFVPQMTFPHARGGGFARRGRGGPFSPFHHHHGHFPHIPSPDGHFPPPPPPGQWFPGDPFGGRQSPPPPPPPPPGPPHAPPPGSPASRSSMPPPPPPPDFGMPPPPPPGPHGPPPPPPSGSFPLPPQPPHGRFHHGRGHPRHSFGHYVPGPPPPPPGHAPPFYNDYVPPAWSQFRTFQRQSTDASTPAETPTVETTAGEQREVSYYAASPRSTRPRAEDLKASLETAKQNYKMEKQRYRAERQARRRERERANESFER